MLALHHREPVMGMASRPVGAGSGPHLQVQPCRGRQEGCQGAKVPGLLLLLAGCIGDLSCPSP